MAGLVVPCAADEASLDLTLDWARTLLTHLHSAPWHEGVQQEQMWKHRRKTFFWLLKGMSLWKLWTGWELLESLYFLPCGSLCCGRSFPGPDPGLGPHPADSPPLRALARRCAAGADVETR